MSGEQRPPGRQHQAHLREARGLSQQQIAKWPACRARRGRTSSRAPQTRRWRCW